MWLKYSHAFINQCQVILLTLSICSRYLRTHTNTLAGDYYLASLNQLQCCYWLRTTSYSLLCWHLSCARLAAVTQKTQHTNQLSRGLHWLWYFLVFWPWGWSECLVWTRLQLRTVRLDSYWLYRLRKRGVGEVSTPHTAIAGILVQCAVLVISAADIVTSAVTWGRYLQVRLIFAILD